MTDEFSQIEEMFRAQGAEAVFELLMQRAREDGNYRVLFDTGILGVRHRLGLPLIETEAVPELTAGQRPVYEAAFRESARAAGELCLSRGDIAAAWPYFKAIGEHAPVAAAMENGLEARISTASSRSPSRRASTRARASS